MIKLKNEVSYIPVLNGTVLNCAVRDDLFINGKRMSFFTNDGFMKYNKYLINPFHHADMFVKIKKNNLLREDDIILADSGGLQEVTLNKIKYTPEEVFQWQQEHSDIGFSVDCLPFITPKDGTNKPGSFGGWKFDKQNFAKYAKKSKNNIDITKKYRDRKKYPNFNFYGIIQGRNYDEYLEWYNILKDDEQLDGYCCKAPNINPMTLAETAIFAIKNIKTPIHFLGIGNISRAIVLYYAGRHFDYPITFDSSSYDVGTQFRTWLNPLMFNRKVRLVNPKNVANEDKDLSSNDDIMYIDDLSKICSCDACRAMSGMTGKMIDENSNKLGSLLSLHNLDLNIKINNYVKVIMEHDKNNRKPCEPLTPKLKEFVEKSFEQSTREKIFNAFNMIDLAMTKGHEYALRMYADKMQTNDTVGDQKGLFDF